MVASKLNEMGITFGKLTACTINRKALGLPNQVHVIIHQLMAACVLPSQVRALGNLHHFSFDFKY